MPSFSGLWLAGPKRDYLFYDDTTSPVQGRHSLFHEIAHMLRDHRSSEGVDSSHMRMLFQLFPTLDPMRLAKAIQPGLCRTRRHPNGNSDGYTDTLEAEAETLASMLWQTYGDTGHRTPQAACPHNDHEVITRMATILGNPGQDHT
jgi:hypothetical protein